MDVDDPINQLVDGPAEQKTPSSGTTIATTSSLSLPSDETEDPARPLITSFNFPAVALSLGPGRWDEVRDYFFVLAKDKNVRVRRTIAAGLGEIARILGSELTERDLYDIWQDKVHDTEDSQTRLKTLSGISMFVGALTGMARESVYDTLVELWGQWLTGWRERENLAGALPELARLAEGKGDVVRILMGKALLDNVAAVREAAVNSLTQVFAAFERRPLLLDGIRDDLKSLAGAHQCRRRATYIACCSALVEGEMGASEIAREEFWVNISHLSQDKMLDVRIGVARLIGLVCEKHYATFSSRPQELLQIIRRLSQDDSRDVRAFIARLLVSKMPQALEPATDTLPPVLYAIFSRPPPKTPAKQDLVKGMQALGIPEDTAMEILVSPSHSEPEDSSPPEFNENDTIASDHAMGLGLQSTGWKPDG